MDKDKELTSAQMISLDLLEENEGQLFGLPANPREIADEKYELLKADIQKYPQFLRYNALKVYPLEDGKYIVIGGNMRCRALKELGFKEVPCVVIPKETPVEDLKAYVILDNSGFGRWDWTMLSSEDWSNAQLAEWGVDIPEEWKLSPDDCDDEFTLPDSDKGDLERMTFILSNKQVLLIKDALKQMKDTQDLKGVSDNENSNGNALYSIVKEWVEQKK